MADRGRLRATASRCRQLGRARARRHRRRAGRGAPQRASRRATWPRSSTPRAPPAARRAARSPTRNLLADARNATAGALTEVFDMLRCSTLLFLPLAHAFARIIQVGCLESGIVLGHTPSISDLVPDLASFQPTFLLAVPRVFEKVYNTAQQQASESPVKGRIFPRPRPIRRSPTARRSTPRPAAAAARAPPSCSGTRLFDRLVYGKLRRRGRRPGAVRGLRRRGARRAARPLLPRRRHHDPRGLRDDRDHRRRDRQPAEPQQDRHRRAGRCPAPASGSPTTARSCIKGPIGLLRLLAQRRRHRRGAGPRTGGSTPATSARSTTRASCGSPAGRRS